MTEPLAVEVADLAVRFRQRERTIHAVNGVSFRLARGEVLGILGESGSGKSVTLRALMRLLPANCEFDGRVKINGEDITEAPTARLEELRGGSVGMIFQEPASALDPVFTIGEQIAETIVRHEGVGRPKLASGRSSFWSGCRSRPPGAGSTPIRTKCPAGCASAR
jgi:peptide/nickel transport system ATP-binding protein